VSGPAPEAALDYSNQGADHRPSRAPLGRMEAVLAGLGLAGSVLAIVAEFSAVIRIRGIEVTYRTYSGYDRHSVALVLLGVFGAAMVAGALRGARPAMLAVAATGLAILLIALIVDVPDLHKEGVWSNYEDARAMAGAGFRLETLAGVLMLLSGVGMRLVRSSR
jgi:hypothetical protein